MINAWSLAGSVMDGTLDDDYPIMSKCKYEEDQTLELAKKYIDFLTSPRGQSLIGSFRMNGKILFHPHLGG